MATIVVDGHGNTLGDVAPDLGSVYGQSNRGSKRFRSSSHIVQNALDGILIRYSGKIMDRIRPWGRIQ